MRIVCLLLSLLWVAQTGARHNVDAAKLQEARDGFWPSREGLQIRQTGYRLYRSGEFHAAIHAYEEGYRAALSRQDHWAAGRFLNNIAGCHFALFDFRMAMRSFLEARALSTAAGDTETKRAIDGNMAGLYAQMGAMDAAAQYVRAGLDASRTEKNPVYLATLLQHLGWIEAKNGELEKARRTLAESAEAADRAGDHSLKAKSWDKLGYEYALHGRLEEAAPALLEAYRIRRLLCPAETYLSYSGIFELLLRKGDLAAAAVWGDKIVKAAEAGAPLIPLWMAHYKRGVLNRARGMTEAALADFRLATQAAHRWRLDIVPSGAARLGSEVSMSHLYSDYISAAHTLIKAGQAGLSRDRQRAVVSSSLAKETLLVAEQSHAWSLKAMLIDRSRSTHTLPEEYFECLARFRAAEEKALRDHSPALSSEISRLLSRMTELETLAGVGQSASDSGQVLFDLETIRNQLSGDELMLMFSLGESESFAWAISSKGLLMYSLPQRATLARDVERFRKLLVEGGDPAPLGRELYRELFGPAAPLAAKSNHLRIVPDDVLYELPFAALATSAAGEPVKYLIEASSIQIAPSLALALAGGPQRLQGGFLGVGDPVYNAADPRWKGRRRGREKGWLFEAGLSAPEMPGGDLPRLAGSSREVAACARAWESGRATLLTGENASHDSLLLQVAKQPAAIHFAAHVVPSRIFPQEGLIALSLSPDGSPSVLTQADIAALNTQAEVVTLSACGSGAGRVLPSAGLLGLTRAWLLAGARTVVASFWQMPDDSGEMFADLYRNLQNGGAVPSGRRLYSALRQAQLRCLQSPGPRSKPSYWAAYFAIGGG